MGYLAAAFSRKASSAGYDMLRQIAGWGRTSASGKVVSVQQALEVSAALACGRVRANGLAQVPCKLMRTSADERTRKPAKEHPLYRKLESRPNDWQTAFEYWETLSFHLDFCGNHYSFINRSNRAGIMELIPFEPGTVTVKRADDWTLRYFVRGKSGEPQEFPAKAIWHVRGPSWNSWMGLHATQLAREALGLAMSAEEQQSRMQRNSVRTSGVYSVPGTLPDGKYKDLKDWIDREWTGPENAGKAMILDRGATWLNTTMTGVDAQTLETRKFQVEEICRHFGVNPILVFAESKNTTYASAEQMFLAHVVHTLAPTYRRIEQSIDANLLTEADRRDGLYANFVDEGLLRGSLKDKHEMILADVNGGLLFPNEGRALLDLNPDPDPESNKLRIPANIVGDVPAPDTTKPTPTAKALEDLRGEVKALSTREVAQHSVNFHEGAFKVHAGDTTITAPAAKAADVHFHEGAFKTDVSAPVTVSPAAVTVNVPEQKAADVIVNVPEQKAPQVQVDIAGSIVNVPEQKAPIVNVDVAAAVVNVAPAEVKVIVEADTGDKKTVYDRDPTTKEILGSTTKTTKRK